ncbi:Uncharacterized protein dnl_62740 [Desulfonema limicola]|uniref:Uncharacterized protein n=1 Tax=Desulfonema limicola TaxID=45656 RepID=A0A975BDV5_9BACT|nr:Uncharacterized protein dnl_62740 [Desulfonema limicola]
MRAVKRLWNHDTHKDIPVILNSFSAYEAYFYGRFLFAQLIFQLMPPAQSGHRTCQEHP